MEGPLGDGEEVDDEVTLEIAHGNQLEVPNGLLLLNVFVLHEEVAYNVDGEHDLHHQISRFEPSTFWRPKARIVGRAEGRNECIEDHNGEEYLDGSHVCAQDEGV